MTKMPIEASVACKSVGRIEPLDFSFDGREARRAAVDFSAQGSVVGVEDPFGEGGEHEPGNFVVAGGLGVIVIRGHISLPSDQPSSPPIG